MAVVKASAFRLHQVDPGVESVGCSCAVVLWLVLKRAERCLPNLNVRRCLETSLIGPHRLVLAKGIEGAELSGGAVKRHHWMKIFQ